MLTKVEPEMTPQLNRHPLTYAYPWLLAGIAPLLFVQGRHVRKTVLRLPEADGERAGVDGEGRLLRLLIAGDSAAAGVGVIQQAQALAGRLVVNLAQSFRVRWQLVARSGWNTSDLIAGLQMLPETGFDVAVISCGVNDVAVNTATRHWVGRQHALANLLETRFGARQIVLAPVPPMHLFPALPQPLRGYLGSRARHYNNELRSLLLTRPTLELVGPDVERPGQEMASDGFHPGASVYADWAHAVAVAIAMKWPQQDGR